jgi:hypothetical protein
VDQDILVREAKKLTVALDTTVVKPKGVMWAISPETELGKLWIVPRNNIDKREFYSLVASSISTEGLNSLDVGMVELVDVERAKRMGLGQLFRVTGLSDVTIKSTTMNGVSLPDGIIFRMDL